MQWLRTNDVYQWLSHRLSLEAMKAWADHKQVPVHRYAFWYYMGGIVLILIVIQFLTGTLLMVYYIPEIKSAHTSILTINSQVDFGWLIRSLHAWSANLLILGLFFHLFSTYLMKAYRPPREITWWAGLVLMGIMMGYGFSGYLLPWDQVSFFATKVGIDISTKVPFIGDQLATLLRGGATISQETLSRFFTLHVMGLALILLPFLTLHLILIQTLGTALPPFFKKLPPAQQLYEKFFPEFMLKDFMGWLAVLNLLAILVTLYPVGIGPEAQPFQPAPMGIKPEWYFLFLFQFFKLLPAHIGPLEGEQLGLLLFGLVVLSLFVIPFWDQGKSPIRDKIASGYGIFLLLTFVSLTLWGFIA
jgi:quinol-cytochrome oxidoreductase complex cytochrome b subunit